MKGVIGKILLEFCVEACTSMVCNVPIDETIEQEN